MIFSEYNQYFLGYIDTRITVYFDYEMLEEYFRTCNVAPLWVEIIDWGSYDYDTDEGQGFYATVRANTICKVPILI